MATDQPICLQGSELVPTEAHEACPTAKIRHAYVTSYLRVPSIKSLRTSPAYTAFASSFYEDHRDTTSDSRGSELLR